MRSRTRTLLLCTTAALGVAFAAPSAARAFCGFYVSGAGQSLYNDATQVVLMRDGLRTVLSMQNNYKGPAEDFAMVVPVPVVLSEEDVKTLPHSVFERIDELAAPRLVEYWEQDPCQPIRRPKMRKSGAGAADDMVMGSAEEEKDLGVTIEAQFKVGEYEIVILSAEDSTGLDTWLRREKYQIPEGAEPLLRPYVERGSKFFVARVDVQKVKFDQQGRAKLSPLRVHYDSQEFSLPIRLGLINAGKAQDLIVHLLARGQRYEVANYKTVTIPTNINVNNAVRERFGEFYAALFDETLAQNPGAVVTEYSWQALSCDPCPVDPLNESELATLGMDVLPSQGNSWDFVLTRLHARYDKASLGEDLVFKTAEGIVGGREVRQPGGGVEKGSKPAGTNNFQARYIIRHEWTGPITCANPRRGIWGGPPNGGGKQKTTAAKDVAFAPRGGVQLASLVREDIPELKLAAAAVGALGLAPAGDDGAATPSDAKTPAKDGKASTDADKKTGAGGTPSGGEKKSTPAAGCACTADERTGGGGWLGLLLPLALWRRRRAR